MQPESLAPLKGGPYQVRVFVGSQQAKGRVPFEYVLAAQQLAAQTEFVLIEGSGRNALDFHIAYYLGQYIAADPKAAFRVIAKDTGYDVLIQHLQKQGIDCLRHPGLEDALHASSPTPALPRAEQNQPRPRAARAHEGREAQVPQDAVDHDRQDHATGPDRRRDREALLISDVRPRQPREGQRSKALPSRRQCARRARHAGW